MSKPTSTVQRNYKPLIKAIPAIIQHHRSENVETVGIVFDDGTTVRLPNSTPTRRSFTVTVENLAAALNRHPNKTIYGLYHSHPHDPAWPSQDDLSMMEELDGLAGWENIIHIISGKDAIRGFTWNNGETRLEYQWQT